MPLSDTGTVLTILDKKATSRSHTSAKADKFGISHLSRVMYMVPIK